MKVQLLTVACLLFFLRTDAQVIRPNYDATGRELPPGVPRTVDTVGHVVYVDNAFTTEAYQEYAKNLLLNEANQVANELQLPDKPPIGSSNLVAGFISPFGFAYAYKKVGNISTTNYSYGVEQGCKLSDVTITKIDDHCRDYTENYQWPIERMDTNAAYQLATQWLAAAQMDVQGLNRDCTAHVVLDPYWNNVKLGSAPKQTFTPIYYIWWSLRGQESDVGGASVELFLPTKTLLSLSVNNPKYILRRSVAFTNLAAVFPGIAVVTTNRPVRIKEIGAPPANSPPWLQHPPSQ